MVTMDQKARGLVASNGGPSFARNMTEITTSDSTARLSERWPSEICCIKTAWVHARTLIGTPSPTKRPSFQPAARLTPCCVATPNTSPRPLTSRDPISYSPDAGRFCHGLTRYVEEL